MDTEQQRIIDVICKICPEAKDRPIPIFYTPEEWDDRGEEYGLTSVLIVVHAGGDLASFFSHDCGMMDKYKSMEIMRKALVREGVYPQECTCWYSGIYRI